MQGPPLSRHQPRVYIERRIAALEAQNLSRYEAGQAVTGSYGLDPVRVEELIALPRVAAGVGREVS